MGYINQHRSFLTTISIRGVAAFDIQIYGARPGDVSESEGYEIVGQALRRRGLISPAQDFFMSPPRQDPVDARSYRQSKGPSA